MNDPQTPVGGETPNLRSAKDPQPQVGGETPNPPRGALSLE